MTFSKYHTKDTGGTSSIPRQTLREEEMQQRLNEAQQRSRLNQIQGTQTADGGGLRFNIGKLDLNYCPLSVQVAIASVFSANSQINGGKYPDNNWRRGQKWSIPLSSTKRHYEAFMSGEELDSDSGLPHIWHMLANLSMLTEYSVTFPEGDDRLSLQNIKTAKMSDLLFHYSKALEKNKQRNEK